MKINFKSILLVFGLVISILSFNVIAGVARYELNGIDIQNKENKKYSMCEFNTMENNNTLINKLENIGIYDYKINDIYYTQKINNEYYEYNINAVGKEFDINYYDKVDGKWFTKEDYTQKNKVAVVGPGTIHKYIEQNGKIYLEILGEMFEIIGKVGKYEFVGDIYIPSPVLPKELTDVSKEQKKAFINKTSIEKLTLSEDNITIKNGKFTSSIFRIKLNIIYEKFKEYFLTILVGIINCMIFVFFWIEDKRKEFAIMRMLGAKNSRILFYVNKAIFKMILVASVISGFIIMLIQKKLGVYLNDIYISDFKNIIIVMFLAFVIVIIFSMFSLVNIFRMNIVKDCR